MVGTNSDPAVRGMVRVNGLDACGGDSGGGWYWLTPSGRRIAYGIHSRSNIGCHGSERRLAVLVQRAPDGQEHLHPVSQRRDAVTNQGHTLEARRARGGPSAR